MAATSRTCGAPPDDRGQPGGRLGDVPSAPRRPPEPPLPAPLERRDALRVLQLPSTADEQSVKRAYRRLARAHHPDVGGNAATFHELQRAYETLVGDDAAGPPVAAAGRPSRPREDWSSGHGATRGPVDVTAVRWDLPLPTAAAPLSRDLIACWLASGEDEPVRPLIATSRAPGSRLNRAAPKLSSDLTAALEIGPAVDDRDRVVVATSLRAGNRRARRVLDAVGLDGGWVRRRGTASTALRRAASPDGDRHVTAVRTADAVAGMLDRADWPLEAWTLTVPPPVDRSDPSRRA